MAQTTGIPAVALRLMESRTYVDGAYAAWNDELETRDAIILEALDDGYAASRVAEWAGVSRGRLTQIVAHRAATEVPTTS